LAGATHKKDETKKIITKYLKISDPEILEATYQSFLQVTDYRANPNLEDIRNAIDEMAQRVSAANNKKPEDFVNLRFLKELRRETFFQAVLKLSDAPHHATLQHLLRVLNLWASHSMPIPSSNSYVLLNSTRSFVISSTPIRGQT